MELLSERIRNLSESETIQMARLSRELQSRGFDIIDLSLGEPDFDTPEHIKEAAKAAIDEGYTHYTPVPGFADLKQAIVGKFKRDNNLEFEPEQIVVSTGAKQSLANIVLSLLNPGDEAILPAPYWVSYAAMVDLAQGKIVTIPTNIQNDFKISGDQLKDKITEKTKALLFSSPCNPSGTVYNKDELEAIAKVIAEKEDIIIISDEIYEYINFTSGHESIAQFDFIKDRVVVVNGVSKGFAMTGWRLGYIAAPSGIAKACTKMQGQITSGACSISQKAAVAALTQDLGPTNEMRDAFLARRDLILKLLGEIPGLKTNVPQGAFYVFPDVSYYLGKSNGKKTIGDVNDFCEYCLNEANISIVTGKAFGDERCVRLSYATSEEKLIEAAERLKAALAKLG